VRLAGLVFVGAAVLSLISNNNDGDRTSRRTIATVVADKAELPAIGERTVYLETGRGDINVVSGENPFVSGTDLRVDPSADQIRVTSSRGDIELTVAEGTKLRLQTGRGDVTVAVATADLDINSGRGDLDVLSPAGRLRAKTGSGDIEAVVAQLDPGEAATISTGSGDIDLTLVGAPTISATTGSGDVEADGYDDELPPDNVFLSTGGDGTVSVVTGSGDIAIDRNRETAGLR
jgi:DUF4097 and DUF4098 domain-containing protein YvlB